MPARPTTLQLLADHCPRALDHYEAGAPYDRRIFAEGTAAHDVLHAMALHGAAAIEPTVRALMGEGREGIDAEPPLPVDAVLRGRDLAVAAWDWLGGVPVGAHVEVGLGFKWDRPGAWEPVRYLDEAARFRCRLDVLYPTVSGADDDSDDSVEAYGIVVRDYKSAWPTDEDSVDRLQIRAQAVAAVSTWNRWMPEEPSFVRREVVNLRTRQVFSKTTWLDEDRALLESWRRDVELATEVSEVRPRRASPGVGCVGCPYVAVCEDARAWAQGMPVYDDLKRLPELASRYAAATALADDMESLVRSAAANGAIETEGGLVGFQRAVRAEATPDAPATIWDRWTTGQDVPEGAASLARGLLNILDLGATQIRAAAKALFPARTQKAEREEFAATLLTEAPIRKWGVWPGAKNAPATAPTTSTKTPNRPAIEPPAPGECP